MFDRQSLPTQGLSGAAKYNPHLWNPSELRAIFVARQRELSDIVEAVRKTGLDSAPQHILVVGQRGMGKSTLLQRIALAIDDDLELARNWLPLRFPEEQYTVGTLAEFWNNVIDALADALEARGEATGELDQAAGKLAALPPAQQEEAALALIDTWSDRLDKRLLLLVDSTDLLLSNLAERRKKDDTPHWRLRKTLLHNKRLFWIGGSYQALEGQTQYQDAFLDFFQTMELRPLTLAEMRQAILALARAFGSGSQPKGDAAEAEIRRILDNHPERLQTLRQLTGGNPRTTVMLYELFAAGGAHNVKADLDRLLDLMTPLYKARIEALADQPRKILAHILENWAPISLKELATVSQLPSGSLGPQLQRLEQEGLIEKTRRHGTSRAGYIASERFFNIWYLMRNAPRRLRVRLAWLVEFMRLWFSPEQLASQARLRISQSGDCEYTRALADALPEGSDERLQLEWKLFKQVREDKNQLAELFDLDGEDCSYKTPDDYLRRLKAAHHRLQTCQGEASSADQLAFADLVISSPSAGLDDKEKLAEICENVPVDRLQEGVALFQTEQSELVEELGKNSAQHLEQAIRDGEFFPDVPDSRIAYTQLIHNFESDSPAYRYACRKLYARHEDEWTLRAIQKARQLLPQDPELAHWQGYILAKDPNKSRDAETAYREALALDPQAWGTLRNLSGHLCQHGQRFDEATSLLQKAVLAAPEETDSWLFLGYLLTVQEKIAEAIEAYRRAVELDSKQFKAWMNLGDLLRLTNDPSEAETAYRQAAASDLTAIEPWINLGDLLQTDLTRPSDAEAAYREAIRLAPEKAIAWSNLGNVLQDHLDRLEEAEAAYRKAIDLDPDDPYVHANLARLLVRLGRPTEATETYRKTATSDLTNHENLHLQANLWLGNSDHAAQALTALASAAENGDQLAFSRLREQVIECASIGKASELAKLMEKDAASGFLTPFSVALRRHAGENDLAYDLPPELQSLTDDIIARLRQGSSTFMPPPLATKTI